MKRRDDGIERISMSDQTLLPQKARTGNQPMTIAELSMASGVHRTGAPWRDIPEHMGIIGLSPVGSVGKAGIWQASLMQQRMRLGNRHCAHPLAFGHRTPTGHGA